MFDNPLKKKHVNRRRRTRRGSRCLKAVAVALVLLSGIAIYLPSISSGAEKSSPWTDDSKPVASFLFTNEETLARLAADLGLSPSQEESARAAGNQEAAALAQLKDESQSVVGRDDLGAEVKQSRIEDMDYNERLRQIVAGSRQAVEAALSSQQKSMLPGWVANQFRDQRERFAAAATASASPSAQASGSYRVYATQYHSHFGPNSIDVAVPDKYVKFANLGWQYQNGYPRGGNYTVNLGYGGRQLNSVPVKDVGPWNIDDNYWNGSSGPRPRRLYGNLSTGLPEAQAAFFDNYNGGRDQFGRIVSNPAGIDLSPRAGVELGLGYLVSGWVTVSFNWEPPPGGGGGGSIPVYGAIRNRHNELNGAPGQPRNSEYDVPGGRAQDFTNGRLVWNPAAGVTAWIYGGIMMHYDAMGGAGALGLPVSDEEAVPGGRRTRFQRGHIYWSPATNAKSVYGAILGKYLEMGGPDRLGLPLADEEAAGNGRMSRFQRGHIYWSPATNAKSVYGAILGKYLQLGGHNLLGLPLADEEAAAPGGRMSRFQRGHIYWSPATSANTVYGSILGKYLQLGGPASFLGFPVTDEFPVPGIRRSDFQHGAIEWNILSGSLRIIGRPLV